LELLSRNTEDLLVRTVNQLLHGSDGILIARVNGKQDTLDSLALVRLRVLRLFSTVGGQTQELRQNEEVGVQGAFNASLDLIDCLLLGLLERLGPFCLVGSRSCLVLLVDLLELSQLLLVLGQRRLEGRLLQNLGSLVIVENLLGDELIERLASVLAEQGIRLGSVGLDQMECQFRKARQGRC
jgi:hypothetical protein